MKKSKETFVKLITQHGNIIHKVCKIYCYSSCDREDLYQEIVFQLWKSYDSFKQNSLFTTWMYRVALNTALSNVRKELKNPVAKGKEINDNITNSEFERDTKMQIELMYAEIEKLAMVDKAIVMLWLEKRSYRDIAEITGLSESNISVKLVRIREKLKVAFKDQNIVIE